MVAIAFMLIYNKCMKKGIFLALGIVLLSILAAAATMAIPPPSTLPPINAANNEEFSMYMAIFSLYTVQYIGTVLLFLLSLRDFRQGFKKSYYFICAGLALEALYLALFLPIYFFYDSAPDFLRLLTETNGIMLGSILIFVGLRHFAKLLNVTTVFASVKVLAITLVAAMAVTLLLPGVRQDLTQDLFTLGAVVDAVVYGFAAFLTLALRKQASVSYKWALTWFAIALLFNALNMLLIILGPVLATLNIPMEILSAPFLFNTFIFVGAGAAFYKMVHAPAPTTDKTDLVAIVVFTASLASKPADIDRMLDPMRGITAQRNHSNFTAADTAQLKKVYSELEEYLVTKEPLRSLTREHLRAMVKERFDWSPA